MKYLELTQIEIEATKRPPGLKKRMGKKRRGRKRVHYTFSNDQVRY